MRKKLLILSSIVLLQAAPSVMAGDLGINVILSGEVSPGVYGQVELGNAPRPALVYERPRIITVDRRYVHAQPVYLHVPPGHAKHWDKHCREYHACGREVYFVRSREYEPDYHRDERVDHDSYHEDDRDHGDHDNHGNGHGHGKNKH